MLKASIISFILGSFIRAVIDKVHYKLFVAL